MDCTTDYFFLGSLIVGLWDGLIALGCLVVYTGYKLFLEDRINHMRSRP